MFQGVNTYVVYAKPGEKNPLDGAVFIKEGFSLGAFLLSWLWAVYHQIWWLAGVSFCFWVGIDYLERSGTWDPATISIICFGFMALVGFEARDWHAGRLERDGYQCIGVSIGGNLEEAQQRFFDKYIRKRRREIASGGSALALES